jgi:soluble lytic murein transglycosylase-like protein
MKGVRGFLAVLCLLVAAPAVAGTVYRCDGAGGVSNYSSKRISGAHCTAVSSFKASRARAPAPKPPMAHRAAMGEATPVNSVQGSPATIASTTVAAPAPIAAARPLPYQAPHLVRGQVYSYIQDGVRHYTSRLPRGESGVTAMRTIKYSFMETCYACAAKPGVDFRTLRLNNDAYRTEIAAASKDFGVDEAIVRAIIHAESAFNPNALSRVGAQGLMQLMPATARRFGVANAFDAAQNIRGGVQYLAFLLKRFDGDLSLAAAGYHPGEGAVDKYAGVPPYSETQRYVQRVGLLAQRYRGGFAAR